MNILIIKNISTLKYTIKKIKRHIQTMRKYMQNVFDKGLVSKEFLQLSKTTVSMAEGEIIRIRDENFFKVKKRKC